MLFAPDKNGKSALAEYLEGLTPDQMAVAMLSAQPLSTSIMQGLLKASRNESELTADGYKPVSDLGFVYHKK